jgi:DNA-binding MarR family transcriptional regulator
MVKHVRGAPASQAEPLGDQRADFGILLGLAFNAFATQLREHLEEEGFAPLPKSFGYVARNIAETPLTLTELAARLAITSPGALKIVQEMESTGYLERVADAHDARAKRHRLTKRGQEALAAARAFHRKFEVDLARRVGASKVDALRQALLYVVEHHEAEGSLLAIRPM